MKIAGIETWIVDVPYIAPVRAVGWANPQYVILRLSTDEGVTGLGERWGGSREVVEAEARRFVGQDPLSIPLRNLSGPVQSALYDIAGKLLGMPAHRLIGDQVRERVPVAYWSCHMPPEETAREAERAAARGFKVHKLKARSWDIVRQAELISKAAGPHYQIRVDPNTEFRYPMVAERIARELEPYNIESFEDPVLKDDFAWHAHLRRKTSIPQALHLGRPEDVLRAAKAEAIDCVNLSGNVASVVKAAAVAEAAGCPVWHQIAGLSLGIQAAFAVHIGCTISNATMPCDELPFIHENDLVGGGLVLRDGHFEVPTGPGLGIELDVQAVEHYAAEIGGT